jgi:putative lipoic acid-binding regulatory protein
VSDPAKAVLTFPCTFPVKAFGRSDGDFEAIVTSIVRRHVPQLDDAAITRRYSHNGNYLAVTATFIAESRKQLDALYQELSGHAQVLMVL